MPEHRKREGASNASSRHKIKESQQGAKPTRFYSKKQETSVAEAIGGSRTKNSGATAFDKGDVTVSDVSMLMECKTKTTKSDSMSIKREWLDKNKEEAMFMGKKYSALAFNFGPGEENHYIIDETLFQTLLQYLREVDD